MSAVNGQLANTALKLSFSCKLDTSTCTKSPGKNTKNTNLNSSKNKCFSQSQKYEDVALAPSPLLLLYKILYTIGVFNPCNFSRHGSCPFLVSECQGRSFQESECPLVEECPDPDSLVFSATKAQVRIVPWFLEEEASGNHNVCP